MRELRALIVENKGALDAAHGRIVDLLDRMEVAATSTPLGGAALVVGVKGMKSGAEGSLAAVDCDRKVEKLLERLDEVPKRSLTKPLSPFVVNKVMGLESLLGKVPSSTKPPPRLKRGTKAHDKKVDELKKLAVHMSKLLDNEAKLQSDVVTLYRTVHGEPGVSEIFFGDCDGQRLLGEMIFQENTSHSVFLTLLGLHFTVR